MSPRYIQWIIQRVLYHRISEYDPEMPRSYTADQSITPRGRDTDHL